MNYKVLVLIKHFKRIHPCAHICKKGIHKSYSSHGLHNDTARGTMIGSWRPLMLTSISSPSLLTVCWGAAMDGVGLIAARRIMSLPSLIPPKIPPAWLVVLTGLRQRRCGRRRYCFFRLLSQRQIRHRSQNLLLHRST